MAYGFKQFDSSGDLIIDTSTAVQTLIKIDSINVALYRDSQFGANTLDYNLPGVTSQADLEANYVFEQTNAGSWNLFSSFGPDTTFGRTFVSNGVIRFSTSTTCYSTNLFTGQTTTRNCTNVDIDSESYDIYVIGKTL